MSCLKKIDEYGVMIHFLQNTAPIFLVLKNQIKHLYANNTHIDTLNHLLFSGK